MGWLPREKGNSAAGPRPTLTAATSGFSTQMCNISENIVSFGGLFHQHHFDEGPKSYYKILFLSFISGLKVMQGGGFFKQYPEM